MGGMLTLVGTSTNLIVNTMVIEVGLPTLELLDFLPVGAIAALVGVAVVSKKLTTLQTFIC
ncbi:hypothetical protein ASJ32_19940 [Aeromonas salmonicida subsp. salmonicida]|uniref:Uncharacterized protein n=2 Tax=Aeromonas salmonicida TaxID=645 RepID=A0ABP2MWG3_AERSS|nr:hypothetical protein IYQ_18506 [Aeromonas salmonicida subsp. salmonicida 01-B526]OAH73247.1 hypothetical protein AXW81_16195 [Aeromonas salmonicida subsp. salmonicida]PJZ12909.1 hypothetical protein ASJ32_19940 [Aeromonas salmonicida subsp. salmonicida]